MPVANVMLLIDAVGISVPSLPCVDAFFGRMQGLWQRLGTSIDWSVALHVYGEQVPSILASACMLCFHC